MGENFSSKCHKSDIFFMSQNKCGLEDKMFFFSPRSYFIVLIKTKILTFFKEKGWKIYSFSKFICQEVFNNNSNIKQNSVVNCCAIKHEAFSQI